MTNPSRRARRAAAAACCAVALAAFPAAWAQEVPDERGPAPPRAVPPAADPAHDRADAAPDTRKRLVEGGPLRLVRGSEPDAVAAPTPNPSSSGKVVPGRVRWHATLADAQTAARASGKPVLVFQLLGALDDEFC